MLDLTNEQKALFSLLGKDIDIIGDIDWAKVKTEAIQQAVFLLAYQSPKKPENFNWEVSAYQCYDANIKSLYAITELDQIMRNSHFKYVILKGLSSASYYPEYSNRMLGDCDFLIDPNDMEAVKNILLESGYEMSGEHNDHHVVFTQPAQDLEMHFEIPGMPAGKKGEYVREYVKDILTETNTFNSEGYEISVPLPRYHGLILLLHMQHHMVSTGIGLRHLLDWCIFVDRTSKENFWKEDLLPLIRKIGLYKYAQVMTKVGNIYFDTACPRWARSADESLCDAVMEDLLLGGNFGRKNMARQGASLMMSHPAKGSDHGSLYNLWKTLLGGTHGYHPQTLDKYPILYPIFMVEFLSRRIYRVATGQRASLLQSRKYVAQRKAVYNQLELFKTNSQSRSTFNVKTNSQSRKSINDNVNSQSPKSSEANLNPTSRIEEELNLHNQCYFQTVGDSMEPIIHNRKSTVVIRKAEQDLRPLDVALYRRPGQSAHVLHRVVSVHDTYYRICGDNRVYEEKVPKEWVLGYMTGFFPDETETYVSCEDTAYQEYVQQWVKKHRKDTIKALPRRVVGKIARSVKQRK